MTDQWQYDGRYDDVPGPLTRTGHKKAEKAALHDSLMGHHERGDDGQLHYVLPTSHQVFDGLIRRGYTIVRIEETDATR